MPHFEIKLLAGKTQAQKEELAKALVKAAQEVIGHEDKSYSVTIKDHTWEEWTSDIYPDKIMGNQKILFKKPGYTV